MNYSEEQVMTLAASCAQILLENGAEIARVETTIAHICDHYGVDSLNHFIVSNGIMMSSGGEHGDRFAKVASISMSGTHMDRIAAVNQLSREIDEGKWTPSEAMDKLEEIRVMSTWSDGIRVLAAGVGSAAFSLMLGGDLRDGLCTILCGLLVEAFVVYAMPHLSKLVGTIFASALATLIADVLFLVGAGHHINFMVVGAIMPLIPGTAMINGIRDLANRAYISGAVRILDALLAFFGIAIGVGLVTAIMAIV